MGVRNFCEQEKASHATTESATHDFIFNHSRSGRSSNADGSIGALGLLEAHKATRSGSVDA